MHEGSEDVFEITEGDATSAKTWSKRAMTYQRADWRVRVEAYACMHATRDQFVVENVLKCWEGDAADESDGGGRDAAVVMRWEQEIERDHQ